MTDVKVEQCDRDAAANLFCDWCHVVPHASIPTNMRCGNMDEHQFVYAFARHRQAAEKAQQERDAGIVESYRGGHSEIWSSRQANIATAIRSQGHE